MAKTASLYVFFNNNHNDGKDKSITNTITGVIVLHADGVPALTSAACIGEITGQ